MGNPPSPPLAGRMPPGETASFEFVVVSPGGSWDSSLPIAGSRAGAVGLLDLCYLADVPAAQRAVERLASLSRGKFGLVVHARLGEVELAAVNALESCDTVVLLPEPGADLAEVAACWRRVSSRVGLICTGGQDAHLAAAGGLDFVVAKGHEAGGRVGAETCFVLLQRLLAWGVLPVYAWGGVGLHTAAACRVAGASGVFLDWQLALTRESTVPDSFKRRIAAMDGSETVVVSGGANELFRLYTRPGMTARDKLASVSHELRRGSGSEPGLWNRTLGLLMRADHLDERLWPVGQDAVLASAWSSKAPTVGRALARLRAHIDEQVSGCLQARILARQSPLARSHGTEYPIAQGPMTRVSDVPAFCESVARAGGLPFLALGVMRKGESASLLERTGDLLGGRPWGVGMLGFVDEWLRAEQLEAIQETRPSYAIIAGGRPGQAGSLEKAGICTYLHVPSPAMLEMFLGEGARRFVFEGRECGGHVGPRTALVLWDTLIQVLLDAGLSDEEAADIHVLFAGGIHDALSASMVSATAQPLVERGMKVGVLMGTAYLFTEEIVQTGALSRVFQEVVVNADGTVLLEAGPGHAIRCADTEYAQQFESRKLALEQEARPADEIREELEGMNAGRLLIAAKGVRCEVGPGRSEQGLTCVEEADQRRSGIYMMGEVAALRRQRCSISALHEEVSEGSIARLAAVGLESVDSPSPSEPVPAPFDVAIVGMSCLLPGARDPDTFWGNILAKHDAVGEIPPDRFDYRRWFDPQRGTGNKTYSKWGGFLEEIPFDPLKYGIPPAALKSIEPMQLLALEMADAALRDAGYADNNPHRARTSVILGVGGGTSELGANYIFRALAPQFVEDPDESLWGQLPEWTEDSFPGILLNVVAGRIANRFDLGGVNYVIDAACASSLAAVYQACYELANGTSDMVITGGCDTFQNPFAYICFSNTGALSPRGCSRVFDAGADGIAISEGLAMAVLKRREDAERDGDRIYGIIRAAAGSSDGRCRGLVAPHAGGQMRAIERAYLQAGFSPATVGLIEAHGTGTELGDQTECEALLSVFARHQAAARSIALGSVKSMIGHAKCAAGVAGLIKAALAIYHRVLPPTLHVQTPNTRAGLHEGPLYVNSELRPWIRGPHPRRAGVSAFGFGGSNFHVVLEEYRDDARPRNLDAPRRRRPAELFVFQGRSREELASKVGELNQVLGGPARASSEVQLADLAFTLHRRGSASPGACRAVLVASTIEELREQLSALVQLSASGDGAGMEPPPGVYLSDSPALSPGEVAFLFPGQGSQFPDMLRDLTLEFSEVRSCFECADEVLGEAYDRPLSRFVFPPPPFTEQDRSAAFDELKATDVAQPALGICGLAMLRLLASFGLKPAMAAGHSYGELVALVAAGSIDERTLYRLSWSRGAAMVAASRQRAGADLGQMLAVAGDEATVRKALGDCESVWLANLNSPQQTILSGSRPGLAAASAQLEAAGLDCAPIPVACAFHSPFMAPVRDRFAEALSQVDFQAPQLPVYSNVTAGTYPADAEGIRRLLTEQLTRQVRFAEQIEAMYAAGARVFVEAGPKRVLSKLVGQILGDRPHTVVAIQPGLGHGITELLHALAILAVQGVEVDPERLYAGRAVSVVDLTKLEAKEVAGHSQHVWLVNGACARPASQPPRPPLPRAVMKPSRPEPAAPTIPPPAPDAQELAAASPESTSPPPAVAHGRLSEGDLNALAQFQETMREFLRTQQAVMEAYGLTGELPAPPTPAAAEMATGAPSEPAVPAPPAPLPTAPASPAAPPDSEPPPPAAADEGSGAGLEQRLVTIVSERTGYPMEMLDLDTNMEADLGIDSIKRVEIIGAFRRSVFPSMETPPSWFMERMGTATTMRAICAGVFDLIAEQSESAPCPRCIARVIPCELSADESVELPRGAVLLTNDGHGVAESLGRAIESCGGRAVILDSKQLSSRAATEALVQRVRHERGPIGALVHLRPLQEAPVFPGISQAAWSSHVDAELKSLLFLLQALSPELKASRDGAVKVISVSRGGGDFAGPGDREGLHPWRGGLAGLHKTAAREWQQACFRAIDTDEIPEASVLLRELCVEDPVEVGYRQGRRWTVVAAQAKLPSPASTPRQLLSEHDVVLMTGGARGITAQVAHEIALQTGARLVLLGRSPMPDADEEEATAALSDPIELRKAVIEQMRRGSGSVSPKAVEARVGELLRAREIRGTLGAIGRTGSPVEYQCCDVRERAALESVVANLEGRYGGISAVVHGAGIIEDRYIVDKDAASFDRVVGTKVDPILTLAEVLNPDRLKLVMLFSSVAGFYGNPGQGDYAAASEILNRLARRLRSLWPAKVVAMNWGPWSGTGMVTPEVARQLEGRGVGMVTIPAGRRAAWEEIICDGGDEVRVIVGPGPWVENLDRAGREESPTLASGPR